jgi:hypothetical protein
VSDCPVAIKSKQPHTEHIDTQKEVRGIKSTKKIRDKSN